MKNRVFLLVFAFITSLNWPNLMAQKLTVEGNGLFDRGSSLNNLTRSLTLRGARFAGGNDFARINFNNFDENNSAVNYPGARIASQNTNGVEVGDLRFSTYDGSTLTEKMRIDANGNVGIGIASPQRILHVNGETIIEGDIRPEVNSIESRDLGSPSFNWDDVYATGNVGISDRKLKINILDLEYGLEEIMQLRPVTYKWKKNPHKTRRIGFIAQDVLPIIDEVVKDDYWDIDEETGELVQSTPEHIGIYYSDLIPVLTKAIQEQQKLLVDKENRILELEEKAKEVDELKTRLGKIEALLEKLPIDDSKIANSTSQQLATNNVQLTSAKLEQNQPNPLNGSTTVRYFIPEGIKKAELRITNVQGKVIKSVAIPARGAGQTTFDATTLSSGNYQYSLFLDGKLLDTKQMVLTKN